MNIPVQLTSFIGRAADLSELERLLGQARLVTLTGPGGCGKTRLAIQLAGTTGPAFTGGTSWVDLASLGDPDLVAQHVARTLGLLPLDDRPVLDSLAAFIGRQQLLMILDNCEHLSPACGRLAHRLLAETPALRILATSRKPLSVTGEHVYPLSGLPWPATSGPPAADPPGAGSI